MKRIYIICTLIMVMLMAVTAHATSERGIPGGTVEVRVSFSSEDANSINFSVNFDTNVFEFGAINSSISGAQISFDGKKAVRFFAYNAESYIASGEFVIKLNVKQNAPSGTYGFTVSSKEAFKNDPNDDSNFLDVNLSVTVSSIIVEGNCTHEGTVEEKIVIEATCNTTGEKQIVCKNCGEIIKTETIAALNHDLSGYEETKAPTCTEKGEETAKCARCGKVDTREIPALGHAVGEWKETKAATCTEKGEETAKCARCDKVDTREIPALGHAVGEWKETKAATCTEKGEETAKCARCDKVDTREIPALGHNAVWKVIAPATYNAEGLKQKICKRCGEVLDEQIIPMLKSVYKTACTAGIKISELASLKDKYDAWKMVTPIDLTKEGTTRYPLIAGNVYEIGYVEVKIQNGAMTAELVVEAKSVAMYSSALMLLKDASEIKRFTANDYEHHEFPVSISLADIEADQMLMMVACQLTLDQAKPDPKYYNFNGAEHAALIEALNEIIK